MDDKSAEQKYLISPGREIMLNISPGRENAFYISPARAGNIPFILRAFYFYFDFLFRRCSDSPEIGKCFRLCRFRDSEDQFANDFLLGSTID